MIYCNKVAASEEIDLSKWNESKSVIFVTTDYFLVFKCFIAVVVIDLLMMSVDFDDIAIWNINGIDYRCIISGINKSQAVNLLQNGDLSEKSRTL